MDETNVTSNADNTLDPVRSDGARVMVLGMNAWLVLAVLPMMLAELKTGAAVLWSVLPLPALIAGVLVLGRSQLVAAYVLLGGFPTLLAALLAVLPRFVVQTPYSTVGLLLGAASLVAYGAAAVFAVSRPRALRVTTHRPLGSVAPIEEPGLVVWSRRTVLAVGAIGAIVLAVVAPVVGGMSAYEEVWGEAAPEASVLAAVVGGALGTCVIALFVGPALRTPRSPAPTRRQVRSRVTALLFSVAIGVLFWVFYFTQQ